MFSPKTNQLLFALVIAATSIGAQAEAQNTASNQYQARMAAMQQAQARANTQATQQIQTVSAEVPIPSQQIATGRAVSSTARNASRTYRPGHTRTAQLLSQAPVVNGGSPIVADSVVTPPMSSNVIGSPVMSQSVITPTVVQESIVDPGMTYGNEVVAGCDSCGDTSGYFTDDCCGRGGCPDDVPCWTGPLGRALRNGVT